MRRERIPNLTHLQFLVLGVLHGGEQPGRIIRDALAEYGVRRTTAAFYQLMARLERDGLVDGYYGSVAIKDQNVTERRYRITASGSRLWAETRTFYESVGVAALEHRWSDA